MFFVPSFLTPFLPLPFLVYFCLRLLSFFFLWLSFFVAFFLYFFRFPSRYSHSFVSLLVSFFSLITSFLSLMNNSLVSSLMYYLCSFLSSPYLLLSFCPFSNFLFLLILSLVSSFLFLSFFLSFLFSFFLSMVLSLPVCSFPFSVLLPEPNPSKLQKCGK